MAKNTFPGWVIPVVVVVVLALAILGWIAGTYNSLVKSDVAVDTAWGQVEVVYQRRADLIPNIVETVKGAANFEQSTLTQITAARSAWTNAKTPEEKVAAANGVESALSRLMVVVENYPTLTATQGFRDLTVELANTENKISVERGRYNDAVGVFNLKIRSFPTNIIAGMLGFEKRTFFKSAEGSETAPKVKFD